MQVEDILSQITHHPYYQDAYILVKESKLSQNTIIVQRGRNMCAMIYITDQEQFNSVLVG